MKKILMALILLSYFETQAATSYGSFQEEETPNCQELDQNFQNVLEQQKTIQSMKRKLATKAVDKKTLLDIQSSEEEVQYELSRFDALSTYCAVELKGDVF